MFLVEGYHHKKQTNEFLLFFIVYIFLSNKLSNPYTILFGCLFNSKRKPSGKCISFDLTKIFYFSVHYYIKSFTHKSLFTLYHFVYLFQLFQVIGLIFGKIWGRWQKQWGKDIIFECNTWISYFLVIITMKPLIIFTIFSDYIYLFVLKSYDILCS